MSDKQRKRHDGSVIDPVKDLDEYVQSFDRTAQPEPPEKPPAAAAQTTAPEPTPAPAEPPPPPDPVALEKARADDLERKLAAQRAELDGLKQQRQIDEAARRAVAEQQRPAVQAPPPQPREDPRWKEVDDKWFTNPVEARALMRKIQEDELTSERQKTKQEVLSEVERKQQSKEQNQNGRIAWETAKQKLIAAGVREADINPARVGSVYMNITRPPSEKLPNEYYTRGGPLVADVIVDAWRDLFGLPNAQTQTPVPTITTAPPGSSRPAPAAVPQRPNASAPIDPNLKKDYEHVADVFGYKPEDLLARRRARLEREGR